MKGDYMGNGSALRVLREEIKVGIDLILRCGPILSVAYVDDGTVEFWFALYDVDAFNVPKELTLFGTGQPVPAGWSHVGTAGRTRLGLVWHLFARTA